MKASDLKLGVLYTYEETEETIPYDVIHLAILTHINTSHELELLGVLGDKWSVDGQTWPTRLKKFIYQKYRFKLPEKDIKSIGDMMKVNVIGKTKYYFDFTKDLDWNHGDFGDRGSCYWGTAASNKRLITKYGAHAIRFYNPLPDIAEGESTKDAVRLGRGYGRSWLMFPPADALNLYSENKTKLPFSELAILFNAYPKQLQAVRQSRILANKFSLAAKRVRLYIRAEGYEIYVNGRTDDIASYKVWGTGYVIGKPEELEPITTVEMIY